MILQKDKPQDYVIGTGETHAVREFVEKAFKVVGTSITWEGEGIDEIGKNQNGEVVVKIDPRYFRPTEVEFLLSDPTKAKTELGWTPETSFDELVKEMVEKDIEFLKQGKENE